MTKSILVLGAAGMVGHKIVQRLGRDHAVVGTIRDRACPQALSVVLGQAEIETAINLRDWARLEELIERRRPSIVINAAAWIKQRGYEDAPGALEVNSLLPQRLAGAAPLLGFRLIQISTDCVFSGLAGPYSEDSIPDPVDLYGRSKLLGEVDTSCTLVLRTSFIGHELRTHRSLLDWFTSQRNGRVSGYSRALFSGLTTLHFAEIVAMIVACHGDLSGLWHVSGDAITKHDLLSLIDRAYGLGIAVDPDDAVVIDRRLDSSRFRAKTGWSPPSWESMIEDMRADPTFYPARQAGSD